MTLVQKSLLGLYLKARYRHSLLPGPPTRHGAARRDDLLNAYRGAPGLAGINIQEIRDGSIKEPEACFLWDVITDRRPSIVLQVGTFVGLSALMIAEALKFNERGILYAVDPEISHRSVRNPVDICRHFARERGLADHIRFINGWFSNAPGVGVLSSDHPYSDIPTVSQALLGEIGPIDVAFIDGDHSTLSCITDFMAVKTHLSEKGIILFHDANSWISVMEALVVTLKDPTVRRSFRAGGFWKGDGIFFMERIPSGQPIQVELSIREAGRGTPVPNAVIRYREQDVARTGLDGCAIFEPVTPGGYEVDIEAPGYHRLRKLPVVIRANQPRQQVIIEMRAQDVLNDPNTRM